MIPEIPRVVRLVRAVVLSVREEPYVEAAIAAGTRLPLILVRHVLPNTIAPLIVQATYICASAMLTEAILGFLGAGIPAGDPELGQHHGRGPDLLPDFALDHLLSGHRARRDRAWRSTSLGDGLRDTLDPRIARKMHDHGGERHRPRHQAA